MLLLPSLLISNGTAYASGEQYALYYDPNDAASISQAFQNNNPNGAFGPGPGQGQDNFSKTFVYAKGGVFGNQSAPFTYDATGLAASPLANGDIKVTYSSTLNCSSSSDNIPRTSILSTLPWIKGSYKISLPVQVSVALKQSDFPHPPQVMGRTVIPGSFSVNFVADPQVTNASGETDTFSGIMLNRIGGQAAYSGNNLLSDLAKSCLPSGYDFSHNSQGINIKNYNGMSAASQKGWPSLKSLQDIIAANFAANNPAPTPSAPSVSCDVSANPLTWILCPVIDGMQELVSKLNDEINKLMAIGVTDPTKTDQPTQVFCPGAQTGTCGSYYKAWSSFRDLALGLMVIAGLVAVISHALGMEILDAYTIRKVLPRLLIAAVTITLSWQIMEFLVTLSNDLGYGIGSLINTPFSGLTGSFNLNGTNGLLTSLVSAGAITALGIFGLLSFLATAAIAVVVAFLTLIVRQLVVIILVLIAPIALVAYILPNTQRFYKLWRDVFSKTLLMFPLIIGFIAGGRVLAAVALQTPGFTQQVIGLIAYFGPYFAIPLTFRLSGGIMSTVGNAINARGEGSRNFLRQSRANRAKQRIERARAGTLWREDFGQFKIPFSGGRQTSLGHLGNRAAINLWDQDELVPHRLGKYGVPGFKRGRYVAESKILDKKMDHNMNAFQALQKAGGIHYSTGRAMTGSLDHLVNDQNRVALENNFAVRDRNDQIVKDDKGNTVWNAPTGTMELVKMANILEQDGTSKGTLAAQELKADAGTMGSLRATDMHRADFQTVGLYATAAQGRTEMEDLTRIYNTKAQKNPHEAARVIGVAQDLAKGQRPSQRRGHGLGFRRDAGGNVTAYSVYDNPNSAEAIGSVMSMHPNEIAAAKSGDVAAIADTIRATASLTKMNYNENHELVDTGEEKIGEEKMGAQAMRQKFLQIAGPYGYSDAGGATELTKIEGDLKFTDAERQAHRAGFNPEDPALRGGGEPPPETPNPPGAPGR